MKQPDKKNKDDQKAAPEKGKPKPDHQNPPSLERDGVILSPGADDPDPDEDGEDEGD